MNISRIEVHETDIGDDVKEMSDTNLKQIYLSGCNRRFLNLSNGQKHFHREIVTELRIRGFESYMDEADAADHENAKFKD